MSSNIDSETRKVVEQALEQLARSVATIELVSIDVLEDLLAAAHVIMFAEAAAHHQPWLRSQSEDYSPLTRDRLEAGAAIPAVHYINAQRRRRELVASFESIHESFDLLALPATPTPAIGLDETALRVNGIEEDVFRGLVRVTGPFNVTGAPAISIPCGWTRDQLPVGLQLAGRPFEDHIVLAAARCFEDSSESEVTLPSMADPGSSSGTDSARSLR